MGGTVFALEQTDTDSVPGSHRRTDDVVTMD